jgi:hypothetical protein
VWRAAAVSQLPFAPEAVAAHETSQRECDTLRHPPCATEHVRRSRRAIVRSRAAGRAAADRAGRSAARVPRARRRSRRSRRARRQPPSSTGPSAERIDRGQDPLAGASSRSGSHSTSRATSSMTPSQLSRADPTGAPRSRRSQPPRTPRTSPRTSPQPPLAPIISDPYWGSDRSPGRLQNRQGVATRRLEGSIPSPPRGHVCRRPAAARRRTSAALFPFVAADVYRDVALASRVGALAIGVTRSSVSVEAIRVSLVRRRSLVVIGSGLLCRGRAIGTSRPRIPLLAGPRHSACSRQRSGRRRRRGTVTAVAPRARR